MSDYLVEVENIDDKAMEYDMNAISTIDTSQVSQDQFIFH